MEKIKDKIKQFLSISTGFGYSYGYGSGDGYGYGYGFGSGFGSGSGSGSGSGFGSGFGYGDGEDINKFNGDDVYNIDNMQTIIKSVHGNYAKGLILNSDLTLTPCFIAKEGNFFAHGKTLKEAVQDAHGKYMQSVPVEERIAEFNRQYPDRNEKVDASELFQWHNTLTGSCLMGREQFCKERNLDYKKGKYTVNEFIELTLHTYGGEIIKKLRDSM